MTDETLKAAFNAWEELSLSQEKRLAYEARLKQINDEEAAIREAQLRVEEAERKGLQKGMQKGKQEAKKVVARRLLVKGMDIESIAEVTKLKKEQIMEMQD